MMKKLLTLFVIAFTLNLSAQVVDKCPPPTKEEFSRICSDLYARDESETSGTGLSYAYQEKLWKISCAIVGKDNIDVARKKIQNMWMENRQNFRCYNYPTSIATDKNITKFSLDTGFTGFISEGVKKYKFDMNFLDPSDNKTLLDFVFEQEQEIRKTIPINTERADEYNRIYKMLVENGAKHSWELNE